jgi:hypothetical protein
MPEESRVLSPAEKYIKAKNQASAEKERKENPPYYCSVWGVLPGLLPGFFEPSSIDDESSMRQSLGSDEDSFSTWSRSTRKSQARGSKFKAVKHKNLPEFENTTAIGIRRKYFDLERELATIK